MTTGSDLRGIEIHDATVVGTVPFEGGIVLQLHVFVHDDFANGNCSGVWQRVDLRCWGATIEQVGNGEPWALEGYLKANGVVTDNLIPVPFDEKGSITLEMQGADFALAVTAERMLLEFAGPPENRESGVPRPAE